jgi:tetratricopeptide (TPR) repeat protein
MTDPLRTDHLPEAGEVPERERNARVEGLLLAGLDHYFSGQYELAISVWTRVLFLDRGHARAKAYIDRARGAVAERQREGDELLHTGAAAFDRGDAGAARRLLNSAVELGASTEEALSLLERLNRLEQANPHPARSIASRFSLDADSDAATAANDKGSSSRVAWIATGVFAGLAAAGVVAWIALTRPQWLPFSPTPIPQPVTDVIDPLPVPSPSDVWLSRAKVLYEDGHLREALRALDAVAASDRLKGEADELRAAIQKTLLDASRLRPSTPVEAPKAAIEPPRPRPSPVSAPGPSKPPDPS